LKVNQTLIIAISIWAVLLAAHFFSVQYFFQEDPTAIAIDSVVHFVIMGILGWGCYYVIRYIDISKSPSLSSLLNLFAAILVCGLIWLGLSYAIDSLLFKEQAAFWNFYNSFFSIRAFEGALLFTVLVSVLLLLKFQEKIGRSMVEEAELRSLVSETRIQVLNSQINPHFLFNSLNSISAQTLIDPERSREMITGLSEYLRYTLDSENENLIAFEKDLENSIKYMDIERIRFGKRLELKTSVDPDAKNFLVPRMLLQPLLENVIKHAVEKSVDQIKAQLTVTHGNDNFELTLSNDLPEKESRNSIPKIGNGLGLSNLEERLVLNFGSGVQFKYGFEKLLFVVRLKIERSAN